MQPIQSEWEVLSGVNSNFQHDFLGSFVLDFNHCIFFNLCTIFRTSIPKTMMGFFIFWIFPSPTVQPNYSLYASVLFSYVGKHEMKLTNQWIIQNRELSKYIRNTIYHYICCLSKHFTGAELLLTCTGWTVGHYTAPQHTALERGPGLF